jgi:aspartate beta-hydroxylase
LDDEISTLAQAATAAANQGRWEEAERLWQRVRAREPRHPQALYSLGVHAFRKGRLVEAQEALQVAHEVAPRDPMILMSLAVVLRERGNDEAELRAIEAALALDPYLLPALLAKGAHLDRTGRPKAAVAVYRNALKAAPPEPQWPPALRATSVCSSLQVPRLPAIPFFERRMFGWVEALEARTAAITQELQAALEAEQDEFRPYVAYAPGTPVNQWQELNHSRRWSSYFLWRDGMPVAEHQARCPLTTQALREVEMADIGGLCPNAMFSALAPHTHIPPHHGETNARLVVHLPLIVPAGCSYRVGFERRQWQVGEVLVFDDSIEHEARNDGDELRVVLIFDVWNPLLSEAERDMVRAVSAATREFRTRP